ncbi:hypothetical protein EC60172_1139A, partial [Escherichia coli 6.0172]
MAGAARFQNNIAAEQ